MTVQSKSHDGALSNTDMSDQMLFELYQDMLALKQSFETVKNSFDYLATKKYVGADQVSFGTHHLGANGYAVKIVCPKTVVWDQEKLTDLFEKNEEFASIAEVTLKVSEKNYDAASPELKSLLAKARTEKPGKLQFTIEKKT